MHLSKSLSREREASSSKLIGIIKLGDDIPFAFSVNITTSPEIHIARRDRLIERMSIAMDSHLLGVHFV